MSIAVHSVRSVSPLGTELTATASVIHLFTFYLDEQLMQEYGTELIAPNKQNRVVPTQDRRPLRRYIRRYKIERLFAWLFNFRRLVVRYEYHSENFQALVHLAAAVILLRYL